MNEVFRRIIRLLPVFVLENLTDKLNDALKFQWLSLSGPVTGLYYENDQYDTKEADNLSGLRKGNV